MGPGAKKLDRLLMVLWISLFIIFYKNVQIFDEN